MCVSIPQPQVETPLFYAGIVDATVPNGHILPMLPIRDHNPSGKTPFVTYGLIALNSLVFLGYAELLANHGALATFFDSWALFPARLSEGRDLHGLLTSMFLHGGWMHLLGNMLFLYIFGDNLEDEMGHSRYLLFYLASGIAAGLIQAASDPLSTVPTVGASGAIAGIMGGSQFRHGSVLGAGLPCNCSTASGRTRRLAAWPIGPMQEVLWLGLR